MAAAHPFEDGSAAVLKPSLQETARLLGVDAGAYLSLMKQVVEDWPYIAPDILGPFHFPKYPMRMARFGLKALPSAAAIAKRFTTEKAKGLWGGMAAHAIQPLTNYATSAIGLVLSAAGHLYGWPVPRGGTISLAHALTRYFEVLGGKIQTGFTVQTLAQLPPHMLYCLI
ncbi:hypothetical protein [Paraflavitalea speifideaquila]|uniref:hypothetical protein n=1 Tax=Paraflavitalea speifideaquila TaxID=3076558 RepID=UPI0028EA87F5|nr:hypothetical protein [Paraflavitalea speifideiaquila]